MIVLEAKKITRQYPGVLALDSVDFDIEEGEVHALIGENGAGKSTLVKQLTGVDQPNSGEICVNGKSFKSISSPVEAFELGVSVIHQELSTMPDLDVAQNIFVGRLPQKKGTALIDWKKAYCDANKLLELVHADFTSKALVRNLSISQQQLVEVAKAISRNAKVIFMDEPTSSLTPDEVEKLFDIINGLKKEKIAVVYISHKLEETMRIADRVTILRDGKKMLTSSAKDITLDEIITVMVGGMLKNRYPKEHVDIGEPVLEIRNLNRAGVLHDINFHVNRGEILALTGLLGAGRTETVRAIFGADPIDSGEIYMNGERQKIRNVSDAIKAGIVLLTENRKDQGLMLGLSVCENIMTASINSPKVQNKYSLLGFLKHKCIRESNDFYYKKLRIKTPSMKQRVKLLSGGNQQKVVIAKWLATEATVFMFDEPTRGIDVGAKAEIYKIMEELARKGNSIIMISTEIPEVINISDRILVMREGRIVAELDPATTDEETITRYSAMEVKNNGI